MAKSKSKINLLEAFQAVSSALSDNQRDLNDKDSYNHNHGDNMVEIFRVITQAMEERKNASPADQLEYASQLLRKQQNSGSAQMYAQNLSQAAQQFQGQSVNSNNAMQLIQSLLGGGAASQSQSDPLSSLAGSLLGGLMGSSPKETKPTGLDIGDLLSVGMSLLQSQQQGQGDTGGLLDTLLTGSQVSQSPHRKESGKIVANTLINTILPMLLRK